MEPIATHGYAFEGQEEAEPDADELDEATGPIVSAPRLIVA
jgi:hypothetical protein